MMMMIIVIIIIIIIIIRHTRKNISWSTQAKKVGDIRYNEKISYLSDIVAFCNIFTPVEITVGWQHT
jgi:hypothetical protein